MKTSGHVTLLFYCKGSGHPERRTTLFPMRFEAGTYEGLDYACRDIVFEHLKDFHWDENQWEIACLQTFLYQSIFQSGLPLSC